MSCGLGNENQGRLVQGRGVMAPASVLFHPEAIASLTEGALWGIQVYGFWASVPSGLAVSYH